MKVILIVVVIGWIIKSIWERRMCLDSGLPPKYVWEGIPKTTLGLNELLNELHKKESELDKKITEIEDAVGIGNDENGSAASILEGAMEWEDFVGRGHSKEKKKWFRLYKELTAVSSRITETEQSLKRINK